MQFSMCLCLTNHDFTVTDTQGRIWIPHQCGLLNRLAVSVPGSTLRKGEQRSQPALQVLEVAGGSTASFRQYHVDQIAADMKDSICRVSDTPFDEKENANIPTVSYEASPVNPDNKHFLSILVLDTSC